MIEDQPPPNASEAVPTWPLVIEFTARSFARHLAHVDPAAIHDRVLGSSPKINRLVIQDMIDRDQLGRERYGKPLQAFNGRKNLVDAYQELLDFAVYVRNELQELGVDPAVPLNDIQDDVARILIASFRDSIARLHVFRDLIERREAVSPSK
jgi:hypothetical protein